MRSLSPSKRLGARLRSRARVGAPLSPSKLPTPPNHHHHHHAHRSSPSTPLRLAAAAARRQQQSTKIVTQVSISSHTRLKMQMGDGANGHSQISAANSTLQCPEISTVAALAPRERGGDFRISRIGGAPRPRLLAPRGRRLGPHLSGPESTPLERSFAQNLRPFSREVRCPARYLYCFGVRTTVLHCFVARGFINLYIERHVHVHHPRPAPPLAAPQSR